MTVLRFVLGDHLTRSVAALTILIRGAMSC